MDSREAILARIREGLAGQPRPEVPPVPEVWPPQNPSPAQMAARLAQELQEVHAETIRCGSMEQARAALAELLDQEGCARLGAMDRPLCREVAAGLEPGRLRWAHPDATPQEIAELPAGLLEADCLLADTGTAMIACAAAEERLMCYLPPICVVVAPIDRLFEHLPAAWPEIARRAADPQLRGEFVFITGPSRTADIEKILILGVHGPKRLIVLLVEQDQARGPGLQAAPGSA